MVCYVCNLPEPWQRDMAWLELWKTGRVGKISFPQCAVGLEIDWEPILKDTTLWASSPHLLDPFEGLECTHEHHGQLIGSRKTALAAIWPLGMCQRIVAGILKILEEKRRMIRAFPVQPYILKKKDYQ